MTVFKYFKVILTLMMFIHMAESKSFMLDLSEDEQAFIKTHSEIILASGESFEPFTILNLDGKISGFDVDYAKLITERTGLKISFERGNWSKIQKRSILRELDGLSSAANIESRKQHYNFSDTYLRLHFLIIVKKGNPLNIHHIDDLEGKKIGLQIDNLGFENSAKKLNKNLQFVYFDKMDDLIKAIVSEEVDFIILDETADYLAQTLGLGNSIETAFVINDEPYELVFALRNDYPELISIFNKAIRSITPKETFDIRSKWFGNNGGPQTTTQDNFSFTSAEAEYLRKKTFIRVCIQSDKLPFEFINSQGIYDGISKDIFNILANRIGLQATLIINHSMEDTLNSLKMNQCDLITLLDKTTDRKTYLNFTTPIFSVSPVVVTSNDKPDIIKIESHTNHQFAVIRESGIIEHIKYKYPTLNLREVETIREGIELVKNSTVYGLIYFGDTLRHIVHNNPDFDLKIGWKYPTQIDLHIASRLNEPELNSILQKAINLTNSQEFKTVYEKWVAVKIDSKYDLILLAKIFSVIAIFIIVTVIWIYSLQMEKKKTKYALTNLGRTLEELEIKNHLLLKLASTDQLTGIWNRSKLDEKLFEENTRINRISGSFGVLMLDIDYFKRVNDQYGHLIGDEVLVEFSQVLAKNCRETDYFGRWGGEEFLIICLLADQKGLINFAEKICLAVSKHPFPIAGHITASIGVSMNSSKDSVESLIKRADDALYKAKGSGRNCVSFFDYP